jgi:hypothetical protein
MKRLFQAVSVLVVLGVFWSLSGCATILAGKQANVSFSADPEGAQVYVNGSLMGKTPVQIKLENNKDYTIEFREEGYQTKTVFLSKGLGAGWLILDVVFGLVPVIVDAVTGDWNFLTTDNVKVALEK